MTIGQLNTTNGYAKFLKRAKRYENISNMFLDFLTTAMILSAFFGTFFSILG